jgi:hypothetical protein
MAKAKSAKKTQPSTTSGSSASVTVLESSSQTGLEQKVRQRAYELFLERAGENGCPEEDWLRAEAEVLGHSGRRTA